MWTDIDSVDNLVEIGGSNYFIPIHMQPAVAEKYLDSASDWHRRIAKKNPGLGLPLLNLNLAFYNEPAEEIYNVVAAMLEEARGD
ncbi:MAG: hypothetical protein HKN94_13750 [Acidimicrobiales bacterium]|nr:hypothetical protein [Acidimicrobiia bacterium]NNC81204.1 hypothetical protein [Acidimicrobiales bacterium]RZV45171.1 MAG: hypothetical protein EX269_10620 [Acidimicrobiales bacterium]